MTRVRRVAFILLLMLACGGGVASCRLQRPDVIPARMIEPQLVAPLAPTAASVQPRSSAPTMSLRLLETQAAGTSATGCSTSGPAAS